jgi:hypothetical protein
VISQPRKSGGWFRPSRGRNYSVDRLASFAVPRSSENWNTPSGCFYQPGNPAKNSHSTAKMEADLQADYVFRLQTFWSLLYFELNGLPFIKGLVTLGLDGREVYENILTRLTLDEPVTLCSVKPLHGTLLFAHGTLLLNYS